MRFGKCSETLDADLAAIEEELKRLRPPPKTEDKQQPRRTPLPANLPRVDIHHELESTTCRCGCALTVAIGVVANPIAPGQPSVVSASGQPRCSWQRPHPC
ncbi:hypothetical protein [Variovorax ginsengisoli]|uniref:IS66 family transposase n=1 Tax=Variovorax ginsengisoli TaxID=363844 RepID=UPI0035210543